MVLCGMQRPVSAVLGESAAQSLHGEARDAVPSRPCGQRDAVPRRALQQQDARRGPRPLEDDSVPRARQVKIARARGRAGATTDLVPSGSRCAFVRRPAVYWRADGPAKLTQSWRT